MTLLFVDGFDHYATADIDKKWTNNSSMTINATGGRRGGGAISGGSSTAVTKTLAASASWVMGASFVWAGSALSVFALRDVTSAQCEVAINGDGTLSVTRAGTAITGGTSTLALSVGVTNYIEWKVTISDSISANSCKVRVNGVDVITLPAGSDVKATANAFANVVRLAGAGGQNLWDDLYICDQTGSTNNDFLGDVRVDTLFPTADGNYSQFTPSTGSTHYVLVDETAPNTTDYNSGTTVNDRDSYALGNLTALVSQTVYGVQTNIAVLKDDAGAKSIASFVRSGSTNGDGASAGVGTSQFYVRQIFEQDPAAVAAWTEATVNAAEIGALITV